MQIYKCIECIGYKTIIITDARESSKEREHGKPNAANLTIEKRKKLKET